eukprot:CAMPEP_0171332808 /NCGR_PEP_ID=MMETSP0878-20121228/3617_1 /TAXON_ID=67004 /ORGANISM="Thalassiosira weissflogii, Strain CCMP1336" /LENGTH=581 /DNA_ID=CAMNT_0011833641 /DNA_START=469 /DNA_END=2214 /DNA_ORIENTATION=-
MANRHKYHELFLPMMLSSCFIIGIAAFPISTTLSQRIQSHRPFTHLGFRMPPCTSSFSRHRQGSSFYASVTALPAASAWLFTPDRTTTILANTVTSHTSAALDAATTYAADAASIAVPTITHTIYKAPFLSLAISFFLGGLFFGTVAAFVAAIYAFGKENMRRVREVGAILWRRNWSVIKLTLLVTKDILLGKEKLSGFKNRFPAAIRTLKDGWIEVRRVFTESVDAIKKETQMYSAAVGLPGLIPIQYIFDRITPLTLTAPIESALQDALAETARENDQIRKITLKKFNMGEEPPRILEARLFDLGKSDMAFDLEIEWKSHARVDLEMKVTSLGAKIPVTIQNFRFDGPLRLIVVGLMTKEPGYEALLISLPRPPKIGFDLKVAGGLITQIPWLRNEMAKMLDDAVAKEVLWPRRAVVSAPTPLKSKPLLNPTQLMNLMSDDPLLRREKALMASIPDDFRSNFEASSKEDIPDFDIRHVDGKDDKVNGSDDSDDIDGDGTVGSIPRWQFWRHRNSGATAAVTAGTVQLMAQSLKQESMQHATRHVTIVKGVEEEKNIAQRVLGNLFIPRSLVSYASKEMG